MKSEIIIADKKIVKLSKKLAKIFKIDEEDALSMVYEEWDIVEALFNEHSKVKTVCAHLIDELDYTYRIA